MRLFLSCIALFAFSNAAQAELFTLSCVSDKDFMTVFEIDDDAQTIMHLTSKQLDGDATFDVYEFQNVIFWSSDMIATLDISSAGIWNYRTVNLARDIYINTGHYPDSTPDELYSWNQFFTCERSYDGT